MVETIRSGRMLDAAQLGELTKTLQARFPTAQAFAKELLQRGWLTAYQANHLLQGHGAELVLGPYVILERLGEGAAGHILKARHQAMNRTVALKILRKDLLGDKDAVGRFYREVELASQLAHPNIVHSYDAGVLGQTYYLVLEYVEGIDLQRLVKEAGQLPAAVACDYIRQAALGLQHAHEKGLVHRDIKPSNLLVTRNARKSKVLASAKSQADLELSAAGNAPFGVVKLLDLGLARLSEPPRGSATRNLTVLAGNQVMMGTPDYLAPEQALDFHNADIRADIYSLGCTFYFLLAGQAPFENGTLPEKLLKHQSAEPRPIQEIRPDAPAGVQPILRKMTAKRPSDRYQTPGEVAQALTALLATMSRPSFALPALTDSALQTTPAPRKRGSTLRLQNQAKQKSGIVKTPAAIIQRGDKLASLRKTGLRGIPNRRRWLFIGSGAAVLFVGLVVALALLLQPAAKTEPTPEAAPRVSPSPAPTLASVAEPIRTLPATLVIQCGKGKGKEQDQTKKRGYDYKLLQGEAFDGWDGNAAVKSHCWADAKEVRFEVTLPPGTPGVLRLWFVDGDKMKRKQRLIVQGTPRGDFDNFEFVGTRTDIKLSAADTNKGKIEVTIQNLNPAINAVISALEFAPLSR